MDILDSIDELQQKIDALRPFSTEMNRQLRQFYRIGLTYSSNAIEGNSLTLSETKMVLEDGNGRIARLLMNLVLFGTGYPVTIIPPLRRVEYIDALEKSHLTGDDGRFIQLIGSCVKESQKELLRFFHV